MTKLKNDHKHKGHPRRRTVLIIGALVLLVGFGIAAAIAFLTQEPVQRIAYVVDCDLVIVELPTLEETHIAPSFADCRQSWDSIVYYDWEAGGKRFYFWRGLLVPQPLHGPYPIVDLIEMLPDNEEPRMVSPDDNALITFDSTPDGWELHRYNHDGETVERAYMLTVEAEIFRSWPVNGQVLGRYFDGDSGMGFALYDVSTTEATPIIENVMFPPVNYPSLSPDGTQIAYSAFADGVARLHIIEIATQETRIINQGYGYSPVWSPDGEKIAFLSDHEQHGIQNIYVIDVDGSKLIRVSDVQSPYLYDPIWLD
jgi:WD40 repeat protein